MIDVIKQKDLLLDLLTLLEIGKYDTMREIMQNRIYDLTEEIERFENENRNTHS